MGSLLMEKELVKIVRLVMGAIRRIKVDVI